MVPSPTSKAPSKSFNHRFHSKKFTPKNFNKKKYRLVIKIFLNVFFSMLKFLKAIFKDRVINSQIILYFRYLQLDNTKKRVKIFIYKVIKNILNLIILLLKVYLAII